MADTPDLQSCLAEPGGTLLPTSPFLALHYHFGMLLGVEDFDTEQAYHRGKMRLHNAWLHGEGVVWGLAVTLDTERAEIRVARGLALDGAGHELHLEADACINVPAWLAKLPEADRRRLTGDAGTQPFAAHVVIGHKACLTRQVPALMEPCDGAGRDTAYSRVFETVEIKLLPDRAPQPRPAAYHRLRLLVGLDEPRVGPDGTTALPEDAQMLADRDAMLGLPRAARLEKALGLLRECAALDAAELAPAQSADGEWSLFPAADDVPIVLAELHGVRLEGAPGGSKLAAEAIDYAPRPSHVATRTIQELAAAVFFCCGGGAAPPTPPPAVRDAGAAPPEAAVREAGAGPRFDPASLAFEGRTITLHATRALHPDTVRAEAFRLTLLTDDGWRNVAVATADYDDSTRTVTLILPAALRIPRNGAARLVALGTGPTPLLGADLTPLAGATTDQPAAAPAGRDFVFTHTGR